MTAAVWRSVLREQQGGPLYLPVMDIDDFQAMMLQHGKVWHIARKLDLSNIF